MYLVMRDCDISYSTFFRYLKKDQLPKLVKEKIKTIKIR